MEVNIHGAIKKCLSSVYLLILLLLQLLSLVLKILNKVFVILLLLLGCREKKEPKVNIFALREMSDLATVEYTVTKIIKANDNRTWFKPGDRKILMSCEAHIKAGIDMSAISENSFKINGKNIQVTLPEPKIVSFSIPPESVKTEYEETGIFRDKFTAAERNMLSAQAEKQIRNSIGSVGIFPEAKATTALFVTNFLKKLGYENIVVNYQNQQQAGQAQ
jgi:hypothetical protein